MDFWEFQQQQQIRSLKSEISASGSLETKSSIEDLERRLNKMTMVCMALWTFIKEKDGLADEQLAKRVEEIDLSDGKLDGKVSVQNVECSSCGRKISLKHNRCLYCGLEIKSDPFGIPVP